MESALKQTYNDSTAQQEFGISNLLHLEYNSNVTDDHGLMYCVCFDFKGSRM